MAVDPAFWRGKRVLLTGDTGFKGSWAALWLHRLGARVFGYAHDAATKPSLFQAAGIDALEHSTIADVNDVARLDAALAHAAPEIIIHMAAQALVRVAYERPLETYATNVVGTARVLDAARRTKSVRAIVVVTSDKCYDLGKSESPRAEDDALGGAEPYAASKAGAELISSAMRTSLFGAQPLGRACGLATARAGNTIGGGDWARDRLMPDLIASFVKGEAALVRNPDAVRPWQHVLDPLRGYFILAQQLWAQPDAFSQAWNFGPPPVHEQPVRYLADEAAERFGGGARWRTDDSVHPPEAHELRLNSGKAARILGWTTRLDLAQAIAWSVQWYRAFYRGGDARKLVESDLERYEALVPA